MRKYLMLGAAALTLAACGPRPPPSAAAAAESNKATAVWTRNCGPHAPTPQWCQGAFVLYQDGAIKRIVFSYADHAPEPDTVTMGEMTALLDRDHTLTGVTDIILPKTAAWEGAAAAFANQYVDPKYR